MGLSTALALVAAVCAVTGESLNSAAEIDAGIKTSIRNSSGYAKPDQEGDIKAAKTLLAPTPMKDAKGNAEKLKNELVYLLAAQGHHGMFRERYVCAIGLLGYKTLATRLATDEKVPGKLRPVRVYQDGKNLIVDAPFSWALNNEVRGKDWTFFGDEENKNARFQKPYVSADGQVHKNVRVVEATRAAEVKETLKKCFAGRPVIIEGSAKTQFDVL